MIRIAVATVFALTCWRMTLAADSPGADPTLLDGKDKLGLAFVSGPSAQMDGDAVRVEFEVNRSTDVTVEIQDKNGAVVRHLAAGLLGPHAPEPLAKDSLKQSLLWDRKDDTGKSVDPSGLKVCVSLGMGVRLANVSALGIRDTTVGSATTVPDKPNGLNIQSLIDLAVGPDGTVYLMGGYIYLDNIDVYTHIVAIDRDGNYLRELYPPPAKLLPDRTPGLKTLKLADGTVIPRVDGICWLYSRELAFAGKLAVAPDNKNLLVASSKSRQLFRLGLDGSMAVPTTLPDGDTKGGKTGLAWNWYPSAMAVSPDSRSLYVIGRTGTDKTRVPVVYRMNLEDGAPEVFFGQDDRGKLTEPTGLATDSAGNVLIADCGANRVWVVASDGKKTRELEVAKPFAVGAGPKGAVYVLSVAGNPRDGVVDQLRKLSADGREITAVDLTGTFGKLKSFKTLAGFGVDSKADRPLLWIGCTTTEASKYPAGYSFTLSRITDDGDTLSSPKVLDFNGQIYQQDMQKFNAEMNARRAWESKCGVGSHIVQPDGYRYGQLWNGKVKPPAGQLTRHDVAGKEIPFPEMGEKKWYPLVGSDRTGYGYNPRLLMTPQKDLLVSYLRPLPAGKGEYAADDFACEGPDKLTADGKYIRDFIYGIQSIAAKAPYRVDRKGCVYTCDHTLPPGRFAPAEVEAALPGHVMHPRDPFVAAYGSIYKFPPSGGGLVWDYSGTKFNDLPVTKDDLIRQPTVVADKIAKPTWRGACQNIQWQFIGISPVPSARLNICTCTGVVFDLDSHDRLYVPDAFRMCVHVLDSNGNMLLRIGKYGNQDDARSQIAFARPRRVAVHGNRVYVGDHQNGITTELETVYAVEKNSPLP